MLLSIVTQALSLAVILPGARAAEVECWAPDGKTRADNETYVPCNKLGIEQDGVESSCCNLDDKDTDERDVCTTTGLCLKGGVRFRGFCTDKTWESPACVKVCTDDDKGGSSNDTVEITPCDDGTYCCGHNNQACCDTDEAFKIPTQSSVIAEVTETAVVHSDDETTFKNATIGLAVVVGVVAIAAIAAIAWLFRKNKSLDQKYQQASKQPPTETTMQQQQYPPTPGYTAQYPYGHSDMGSTAASPQAGTFSPTKSPGSPALTEAGNYQRYSELDATGDTSHLASPSPGFDQPSHTPTVHESR